MPLVGQGVTAGIPKHVRMGFEAELGVHAQPLDHPGKPGS